ncbi:hypothetical protein F4821DRAFT_30178 [Hypoxylon rubiginosum]|uniref:Uncharacterized protein n=1 Tax=Hypoxylon rubiginosum TaxID=110542 RepID=A0ACC0DCC4_9PEZI|nr:hypothetical protein F4821DRAFT_30178 [Hypoxylon rubiginosum]
MATSISICRGCAHRVMLYRSSLPAFKPSYQPALGRVSGRLYATAKAKPASSKQVPRTARTPKTAVTSKTTATPKTTVSPSVNNSKVLRLSYAQELADKATATTLYEAEPKRIFLFSSYMGGLFCATAAGINIWFNVFNVPEGTPQVVQVGMGLVGILMAAFGTRFALMPAGSIRSIRVLPSRGVRVPGPAGLGVSSVVAPPVRLEIEARRNVPFPFVPLRRFQADPNDAVMKAPLFSRKTAPSEHEKMLMKQEEEARLKAEREYEMNHLMTAPFRHAGQAVSKVFSSLRRGLTGEGFAPIIIGGVKYKLDITSAYVLEEGRALDRIVKIEEDPDMAKVTARSR